MTNTNISNAKWKAAPFLIATKDGVLSETGSIYNGLGLSLRREGSPKGRIKPTWAVTHLGTGHAVCMISADAAEAEAIATEIAETSDWDFDSLEGWRNTDPTLIERVKAVLAKYAGLIHRTSTGSMDHKAREVAALRG